MIRSLYSSAAALTAVIMPLFGDCANAETARSMSAAS